MTFYDDPQHVARLINRLASNRQPFVCLFDFEMKRMAVELAHDASDAFHFDFRQCQNKQVPEYFFEAVPVAFSVYHKAFQYVQDHINLGNSYLLNLSCRSEVLTNLSLDQIYNAARAKYKILFPGQFVCFSPERFVAIDNNKIRTNPMKGTICVSSPDALEQILNDPKEVAEHATIVDLLRNDLSQVARGVRVKRYRYPDLVNADRGPLIQISSEIEGILTADWRYELGDILIKLLPAGSISGAPKAKTLEIISEAENQERGYYTGIFGYYDGHSFDSAVLIRYIEQDTNGRLWYRSGGGITAMSKVDHEYQEIQDKIYVPISRDHTHRKRSNTAASISSSQIR